MILPIYQKTEICDLTSIFNSNDNKNRKNKITGEGKKDIHEKDTEYLERCRKAAIFTAQFSDWSIISCADGSKLRTIEEIRQDVLKEVLGTI